MEQVANQSVGLTQRIRVDGMRAISTMSASIQHILNTSRHSLPQILHGQGKFPLASTTLHPDHCIAMKTAWQSARIPRRIYPSRTAILQLPLRRMRVMAHN